MPANQNCNIHTDTAHVYMYNCSSAVHFLYCNQLFYIGNCAMAN